MAIQGFDYKGFAQNLASQATELVPKDFDANQRAYVTNTLLNFSMLAGEALYNDTELNFNADQAVMITQIIAEWSYHKSVDLIRSGIPQQYWDPIMQKIAFTIFEIAKQTFKQELPQEQILQLIEHHVKKAYLDSIAELKDKGLIDEGLMEFASKQSNIDTMMQEMQQNGEVEQAQQAQQAAAQNPVQQAPQAGGAVQNAQSNLPAAQNAGGVPAAGSEKDKYAPPKLLKLVSLALLLKRVDEEKVQSILERFDQDVAGTVIKYMYVDNLEEQVDPTLTMICLDEVADKIPGATEINKKRLVAGLKASLEGVSKPKLEQMLQMERQYVRRLVFNALEDEYYEMSPRIAKIVASYIQNSV